jgi:hypothetical protein
VVSIVWICAVGLLVWPWKPPFDPSQPYQVVRPNELDQPDPTKPVFSKAEFEAFKAAAHRREDIQTAVGVVLIPPFLLLMLGAALIWAIRGFRAHDVGR